MKIYNNIKLFAMMVAMTAMVGCDNEENNLGGEGDLSFEITSSDFECVSGQEQIVSVPAEGYMYSFMVDATDATSWTVSVEGGAWLTVNPVAKQKGNGEIIIKASENSYNESNRTSLVKITNTANDDVYTYRFNQEYDAEYIRPEYEYFTFIKFTEPEDNIYSLLLDDISGTLSVVTYPEDEDFTSEINDYNIIYESKCELLPKQCFANAEIDNSKNLTVLFTKEMSKLDKKKQYMLPISVLSDGVVEKKLRLIVSISSGGQGMPDSDELERIPLTKEMIKASNTRKWMTPETLVDFDMATKWQSEFDKNVEAAYDETYGIYFDLTLGDKAPAEYLSLNYATNGNHQLPNHIVIYVGENKDNLVKVGELKLEEQNLPIAANSWYSSGSSESLSDLPVFSLNGNKANLVRVAILSACKASDGSIYNFTDPSICPKSKNHPGNVGLSEIRLYGL